MRAEQRVIGHGVDDATGQRTHAGVREEGFFGDDRELVATKLLVGMKFSNGHAAAGTERTLRIEYMGRMYSGRALATRQITARLSAGVQKGISARVQKGTEFRASIFRGFRASC